MTITRTTLIKLYTLSGNICAFPQCFAPIVDTVQDVITGQVCHIKAKSPKGPRYDPNQTPEERDGFSNLMVMCAAHNKIIDDESTRDRFPVEVLVRFKRDHEAQYHNSVVKPALLQRFLSGVRALIPELPFLTGATFMHSLASREPLSMVDTYVLKIIVQNMDKRMIPDSRVEVEVPKTYSSSSASSLARVTTRSRNDADYYTIVTEPHAVMKPKDKHGLSLYLKVYKSDRDRGITDTVSVIVYSGEKVVDRNEFPIADLFGPDVSGTVARFF